jgi:uncharacterized protein with PQ loop repeat
VRSRRRKAVPQKICLKVSSSRAPLSAMVADSIGWIGSVAFAVCGIPQAWKCYRRKTARGLSPVFVGLWLIGEVCYVASVLMKFGWVGWMMFNYLANLFSICVIIIYLIKDRRAGQLTRPI